MDAIQTVNTRLELLPLVVGITGHRDLPVESEGPLRERFGELLTRMQQQYPAMQILVLSGLAAGADIVAAEVALDRGIAVLGCLPMPQADYEIDFTPEELARFRRVLPRCWDVVTVGTSEKRGENYVEVAAFIAYYCHVLVAFWDGLPARGPGGTAQVVELRKGGLPSVVGDALVKYVPDVGPVFQIVTPRKDQPVPERCLSLIEIYPEQSRWTKQNTSDKSDAGRVDFEKVIAHLEQLNRDLARETVPSAEPDSLAALRDRTDAAANRLQRQSLRSLQSLYVVTALAGAAQLILPADGSFQIPSWAGIGARIAFLAVAFVVFAIAKRADFENRYQDYRAIAEALRVQHAWCSTGLRKRLVETSYLQMQQSELSWIRLALRTAYLITGAGSACSDDSPAHPASARWVEGQLEYYELAGKREQEFLRRAKQAMTTVAVSGAVLSAVAAIFAWLLSHNMLVVPAARLAFDLHALSYGVTMPIALGGMLALLIRFYVEQRGVAEHARRYQHMFTVFDAGNRRLREHAGDPQKILEQLGHEALSEHAEWLILHRERPLTFVHT